MEALAAGIPALILDPKGEMENPLLTFPELRPDNFRPWVNEDDARREGISLDALAERTAATWREALAGKRIVPERIAALWAAADFAIYTPGSGAGVPLNVIGSLQAPALSWESKAETLRDEIEARSPASSGSSV